MGPDQLFEGNSLKYGQTEIPGSLFKLARERMLRDDTFTPFDLRNHLMTDGRDVMLAISTIHKNHWIITDRVMRACIDELRTAGELTQLKRGIWARTSTLDAAGTGEETSSDMERLQRVCARRSRETPG